MPLTSLIKSSGGISSGLVTGILLDGQYRVTYKGAPAVATSQAGVLTIGTQVTIADAGSKLVIISAGLPTAHTITEVTISG
jgi:hypothetical protein